MFTHFSVGGTAFHFGRDNDGGRETTTTTSARNRDVSGDVARNEIRGSTRKYEIVQW
jgi:hypothetical protein